jgi:transcription elongation factor GreA
MPKKEIFITLEGRQALHQELEHLSSVRRRDVAARINKASSTGGTVDNAEYDEAKNEQAFVEGRISELENILFNAVVSSGEEGPRGAVEFGSSVTVVTEEGKMKKYKVVGSAEAAPLAGKISNESPVGRALIGHKVDDRVDVETPSGVVKLTIVKVK